MISPLPASPWFARPLPAIETFPELPPAVELRMPSGSGALFPGGVGPRLDAAPLREATPLDGAVEAERTRARLGTPAAATKPKALLGPHKVMAGDRRLIDAPIDDPVRVAGFRTDSRVVEAAQRYLGTPYVWGGADKTGLDCSGFAYRAMKDAGCDVPLSWFRRPVDPRVDPRGAESERMRVVKDPRPGDVVVFGKSHVGIYTGNVDGVPMYISANHGGPWATRGNSGDGRVDVMTVRSHPVQPPVYFRYQP